MEYLQCVSSHLFQPGISFLRKSSLLNTYYLNTYANTGWFSNGKAWTKCVRAAVVGIVRKKYTKYFGYYIGSYLEQKVANKVEVHILSWRLSSCALLMGARSCQELQQKSSNFLRPKSAVRKFHRGTSTNQRQAPTPPTHN